MLEVGQSLASLPSPSGGRPKKNLVAGADKEKSKEVREREKVEKRLTEVSGSVDGEGAIGNRVEEEVERIVCRCGLCLVYHVALCARVVSTS